MAFNRSKRPMLGLGLGLPIAPFGAFRTLRLHLYMLPHEVVTSPHQRVFRHISMLRGVLRVGLGYFHSDGCGHASNHVISKANDGSS